MTAVGTDARTGAAREAEGARGFRNHYAASQFRTETWNALNDVAQTLRRRAERGRAVEEETAEAARALDVLRRIEVYTCFPGVRICDELQALLDAGRHADLAARASHVVRLLVSGVYRKLEIEEQALADVNEPLPRGPMRTPAVLVRLLLPLAGLVAFYLLLRGHDAPGGGFVGGLVAATAVIAQYMAGGTIWVESRLRVHPLVWIGLGLLAAAGAGMIAWLDALPFLTSRIVDVQLPLVGEVHLSTVLLFDLGVFALVIGATLLMLVALAHQSLRSPRRAVAPAVPDADGDGLVVEAESP